MIYTKLLTHPRAIESETRKPIITSKNASELNHVVTQMIEVSADAAISENDVKDNE